MPDLKEVLGEEFHNQLMEKLGDKHKVAIVSDGSWLPKEKFNEVNEANKQLKTDLEGRDKQLTDLKKNAGDNEDLKKQIDLLQTDNKSAKEKYDTDMKDLRTNTALKMALAGEAHDADLVAGLIDKSKIELDDNGALKGGLDDQIKSLRESKAFLFVEKQEQTQTPLFRGAKPPEGNAKPSDSMQSIIEKNILGGL